MRGHQQLQHVPAVIADAHSWQEQLLTSIHAEQRGGRGDHRCGRCGEYGESDGARRVGQRSGHAHVVGERLRDAALPVLRRLPEHAVELVGHRGRGGADEGQRGDAVVGLPQAGGVGQTIDPRVERRRPGLSRRVALQLHQDERAQRRREVQRAHAHVQRDDRGGADGSRARAPVSPVRSARAAAVAGQPVVARAVVAGRADARAVAAVEARRARRAVRTGPVAETQTAAVSAEPVVATSAEHRARAGTPPALRAVVPRRAVTRPRAAREDALTDVGARARR